jgi:hypothetical protein
MTELTHSGSIVIDRSPEDVYDMVADVTRTGEWSPVCKECWWDDGDGPQVGAKFTGRNVTAERTWETRSEVIAADRGRAFAWVVVEPPTQATWSYAFEPDGRGTKLTETWALLPEGVAFFEGVFAENAPAQIATRSDGAKKGIAATLPAIKAAAEG